MNPNLSLRAANVTDAPQIAALYNYYVTHSIITFEEVEVGAEEIASRIGDVRSRGLPWYVLVEEEKTIGYAYATPWRSRAAYRWSVETTVYVANGDLGRGIGTRLYTALLATLRSGGFHTAIGGIALPNDKSVVLHERFGFEKVAHFKEVGFKFNRWIDVGYWELVL